MSLAISGSSCLQGDVPAATGWSDLNMSIKRMGVAPGNSEPTASPSTYGRNRPARPGRGFRLRLERGQAGFEVVADHLVHVHHERHPLCDEVVLPVHRPGNLRAFGSGSEGESGRVGAG